MLPSLLAAGFAVGAALHLLLLVLSRGSQRRPDRLLFYLFGALFLWHAGNLLAVWLEPFDGLHAGFPVTLARAVAFTGLALLSPLLVHAHLEFAGADKRYAWLAYAPLMGAPWGVQAAAVARGIPHGPWTTRFIIYFCAALVVAIVLNARLASRTGSDLRIFHVALAAIFAVLAATSFYAFVLAGGGPAVELGRYVLMLSSLAPSAVVGYWIFRFNFLEPGVQRAAAVAMLAVAALLVYAVVIARLAERLERAGYLPAQVTQALLIFLLVVLVDPLSRPVRNWINRRLAAELQRADLVRVELLERAMHVSPIELLVLARDRISGALGFPVEVDEEGHVTPAGSRALALREAAQLRLLRPAMLAALERSRTIAERMRLERELAEREKMAALGEMTAFIAHRIKNPLSAINTLVQVIGEQAPQTAEHCEVIRAEIRRLTTAVGDLLRFTAPATGARQPVAPLEARAALASAVNLFAAEAKRRCVRLECFAEEGVHLPISSDHFHDLLTCLLGNALEAAPANSSVRVTCRVVAGGNGGSSAARAGAILAVEDEGPGVAPENRERIFEPFFTLKPGGTGLGLALARRRAAEAGAALRCVSPARDGRGARFEVRFGSGTIHG